MSGAAEVVDWLEKNEHVLCDVDANAASRQMNVAFWGWPTETVIEGLAIYLVRRLAEEADRRGQ